MSLEGYRNLWSTLRDLSKELDVVFITATQPRSPRRAPPPWPTSARDMIVVDYMDSLTTREKQ